MKFYIADYQVRYHCVLDTRVGFAMEEIARLVAAFRATDGLLSAST